MLKRLYQVLGILLFVPVYFLLAIVAFTTFPIIYILTGKNLFEKDPIEYMSLIADKIGISW